MRSFDSGLSKTFAVITMMAASQMDDTGKMFTTRKPNFDEIGPLSALWHDGWHDAHAGIVPADLTRLRTVESFADRLRKLLPNTRVTGPLGAPTGLCIIKPDELHQLYVAQNARGTGVAAALVAEAEHRLQKKGTATGWLACAIGNTRAAKFYEKCGWHLEGNRTEWFETAEGPFLLEVWRYEKSLIN